MSDNRRTQKTFDHDGTQEMEREINRLEDELAALRITNDSLTKELDEALAKLTKMEDLFSNIEDYAMKGRKLA